MDKIVIGIDIGGTNFRIGAVDEYGNTEHFEKNSSRIFHTDKPEYMLLTEIEGYIGRYALEKSVAAVSIGLPSIMSKDKKIVISTPNIRGFNNIRLADYLSHRLGTSVFTDRDVNFLLQNDIKTLGLDTDGVITGFYVGTGLGNAIYMRGGFYSGKNGAAGELGHIPLFANGEKCSCGNIGCAETRCSGKYLEALVKREFPSTPVSMAFSLHSQDEKIKEFIKALAMPIAAELNILDPDHAVIAGGVTDMADFPTGLFTDYIRDMTRKPYPAENLDIRISRHSGQNGVLGAADYAFSVIKKTEVLL